MMMQPPWILVRRFDADPVVCTVPYKDESVREGMTEKRRLTCVSGSILIRTSALVSRKASSILWTGSPPCSTPIRRGRKMNGAEYLLHAWSISGSGSPSDTTKTCDCGYQVRRLESALFNRETSRKVWIYQKRSASAAGIDLSLPPHRPPGGTRRSRSRSLEIRLLAESGRCEGIRG